MCRHAFALGPAARGKRHIGYPLVPRTSPRRWRVGSSKPSCWRCRTVQRSSQKEWERARAELARRTRTRGQRRRRARSTWHATEGTRAKFTVKVKEKEATCGRPYLAGSARDPDPEVGIHHLTPSVRSRWIEPVQRLKVNALRKRTTQSIRTRSDHRLSRSKRGSPS